MSGLRLLGVLLGAQSLVSLAACGEEIDVSFGSLAGEYSYVGNDLNCFGDIKGSKISADCVGTFSDSDSDYRYENQLQTSLTATIRDDSIVAKVRWDDAGYDWEEGWRCQKFTSAMEIHLTASKNVGRTVSGQFEAIAGQWVFDVEIVQQGRSRETADNLDSFESCRSAPAFAAGLPVSEERLSRYSGDIDFLGGSASGQYTWIETTHGIYDDSGRLVEAYTNRADPEWNGPKRFNVSATSRNLVIGDLSIMKQ